MIHSDVRACSQSFLCEKVPSLPKLVGVSLEFPRTKEELKQEDVAWRLAAAAPSLQHIVFSQPSSDTSFWQIERSEGDKEVTLKPLSKEESEYLGIMSDPSFPTFDDDC